MSELPFYAIAPAIDAIPPAQFPGPPIAVPIGPAGRMALAGTPLGNGFLNGTAEVVLGARRLTLTKISAGGRDYYAASDGHALPTLDAGPALARALGGAGFGTAEGLVLGFGRGTTIRCDVGEVRVEHLEPGHRLITRDSGTLPLLWRGKISVATTGDLMPVRAAPWSFGAWPTAPLLIAPEQRIAFDDWQGEVLFGTEHVTGTAASLVVTERVHYAEDLSQVEYHVLMLERPAIIYANAAPCESFAPQNIDLERLFPEFRASAEAAIAQTGTPYPGSIYPHASDTEIRAILGRW